MNVLLYDFKKIFLQNPEVKAIVGMIAIAISWSFDGEYEAFIAIYSLVAIDFITGTYHSLASRTWSSRRSVFGAGKFVRYLVYMLVARMVDKVSPVPLASPLMDMYLVVTEAGSILENFQKLGYPVPTVLLTKLKAHYEKKGDDA